MHPLLLAFTLFAAASAVAQVGTLVPVDEAAADPSFVLFRARLLEAVATHDTAFVLAHLHPEAEISFGGDTGVAGFRRLWLDDQSGSDLWTELATFLPLGSTYEPNPAGFVADAEARATVPYWFGAWPDSLDAFQHVLVVGENVNVRAAPSADAPVLTQLSHAIVRAESFGEDAWAPIVLESGRRATSRATTSAARSAIGWDSRRSMGAGPSRSS